MSILDTYFTTKTKRPTNQFSIIKTISREGKQSKASLSKILSKNWSEINDSIISLLTKKLIVEDYDTKNQKEKYLKLTADGFIVAIAKDDDKLITSEQFWNHL